MKIALINGSSRGKISTSLILLNGLQEYLQKTFHDCESLEIIDFTWNHSHDKDSDFNLLLNCDAIVLAFPLYVDSIPSHLLRILVDFEEYVVSQKLNTKSITFYTITNNGYFDCNQISLALDNIKHFCTHIGFEYGQGIGVGGGGMISSLSDVPFGHGPKKSIGLAFEKLALAIKNKNLLPNVFVNPNFPAPLYKILAELNWRKSAKKNGLVPKDLDTQIKL